MVTIPLREEKGSQEEFYSKDCFVNQAEIAYYSCLFKAATAHLNLPPVLLMRSAAIMHPPKRKC